MANKYNNGEPVFEDGDGLILLVLMVAAAFIIMFLK
jgi:hypothetical protein